MGKLKTFEIVFANAGGVYYAGSTIYGHVSIELSEPMSMKGKAKVHWEQKELRRDDDVDEGRPYEETIHYKASEKYMDKEHILYGEDDSDTNKTELPAGHHTFPFQIEMPHDLPSSFEGGIGKVRYVAKCKVDRSGKSDHKVKRVITIIGILDLNSLPAYSNAMQDQKEKDLGCLCCNAGPLSASFHIERQGYVPGEAIRIFADISNGSGRKINSSFVTLSMIATFHASGGEKRTIKTKLARLTRPAVEEHSEDAWTGEELVIPPAPPSFLNGCKIINIKYILELSVDPAGPSFDLDIPFEIVIGTVPLRSIVEQNPPMQPTLPLGFSGISFEPSVCADSETYPPMQATGIPDLVSPSFVEFPPGKVNLKEYTDSDPDFPQRNTGNATYAPVYTYYNFGKTPQAL